MADFKEGIKVIAFDADDTLWDNQHYYERAEAVFCEELAAYGDAEWLSYELFKVETANMDMLGYGAKAFTMSMMETALKIGGDTLPASSLSRILMAGKSLLEIPAMPLPGVADTLEALHDSQKYRLVLFTKGDILDQRNKLCRSGLSRYFHRIEIVANKTEREYKDLCIQTGIREQELLMVGNSFKSDIQPVLQLGGKAIHIPFEVTWQHEHTEEFDHERLLRVECIRQILPVLI